MFVFEIKKNQAEICNAIYDYAKQMEKVNPKTASKIYDKWHLMNETCSEIFATDPADWIEYCCRIECPF